MNDATGVDFVVEQEGGDASFGVSINNGPVDGGGTAILREQRGVEIESAVRGHIPNDFGKHAEGHDNLEVGTVAAQGVQKIGILQLFRLEHGEVVRKGVLFYGTLREFALVAPHRLVGHGDNGHHIVSAFDEGAQTADGKVGGAHEDDSEILSVHRRKVWFREIID